MGIYPESNFQMEGDFLVNTYNGFDGEVTKTYYEPVLKIVKRTNCFCCSCSGWSNTDSYCRNHNMGFGMRPCEVHGTEGQTMTHWFSNEDEYASGEYPHSVQWERWQQSWSKAFFEDRDVRHWGTTIMEQPCHITTPHSHWPLTEVNE